VSGCVHDPGVARDVERLSVFVCQDHLDRHEFQRAGAGERVERSPTSAVAGSQSEMGSPSTRPAPSIAIASSHRMTSAETSTCPSTCGQFFDFCSAGGTRGEIVESLRLLR
jgi:hypothetical protein